MYTYQPRAELRPKGLDGISEEQIKQHWKLYEAYVDNVNELNRSIATLIEDGKFGPEYSELKRRLGFEYNGMILHEHYFSILRKGSKAPGPGGELGRAFEESFGGFESWKKEFTAIGKMRGIGWAILYFDPLHDVFSNHWITLHEEGHPAGFVPILVMDVWEHAYMVDWGTDGKPDYIETFFRNVHWAKVEENARLARRAVHA
ncbi:MAG: superoxide dismutase [Elusimicrobia bacterium]|nr:superoxide dismutase [Elusimicrobiota bacterium]